jgi:hypothetical protein
MTITVVFKNPNGKSDAGQTFTVNSFEAHNTFGFLELDLTDGSSLFINLTNVFTFQVAK